MARLILAVLFFLLSLLCVFPAPEYHLWYVSILVSEFPWIFIGIAALLLAWGFAVKNYRAAGTIISGISFVLFLLPVIGAYGVAASLDEKFDTAFGKQSRQLRSGPRSPYGFWQMFKGSDLVDSGRHFTTVSYFSSHDGDLTLDFYKAGQGGKAPCIIIVHGGSWSGGDSYQLPELNVYLQHLGYCVASLNYRLAPWHHWPAPIEDVHAALAYLRLNAGELNVDTNNFVLLGRSAGGQIVLSAAYTLHEAGLKGVINFYGPTDMVWGYANPANPLVLNTCKIMENYLGGTYRQVPQLYKASSATETVTAGAVPTLLIHGQNDPLVAYEHETRLARKLQEKQVKYFVLTLPWATHGFDYTLNGPGGQLSTYTIERFLNYVTR